MTGSKPLDPVFFMSQIFQKIAILGGGLLGGSAALALREKVDVRLWFRKPEAIASAHEAGFAEATADLAAAVSGADLLILAVPVGAMPALLCAAVAAGLPKDCLVTDVGSVKTAPHRDLAPILAESGNPFIGSHPMAGSERNGLTAARADLFNNAACLLTNDSGAPPELCAALEDFWKSLGCRTKWLGAAEHDRLVARISHLPHVTAAATAFGALSADTASGHFSGGGLRDTTRVAGGNPEMWAEILLENRSEVARSVRETIANLDEFLVALDGAKQDELRRLLTEAKILRDTLP
jgi:prephenate dehydrogenase